MPDITNSYTATSSAIPSALASSFDAEARRRYSAGLLQKSRVESASPDSLPQIDRLGVRSPTLSNVDPALTAEDQKTPRARSPVDPALSDSQEETPGQWITSIRTIEDLRAMVKYRIENGVYEDGEDEDSKHVKDESEEDQDARSLYPVLRAVREDN
jgi:hypothetical protein